jgi:hypothetical protein
MKVRDRKGRYKAKNKRKLRKECNILVDHNYPHVLSICNCKIGNCPIFEHRKKGSAGGWRKGRRVIEFDVLVRNLAHCKECRLGPLLLTSDNVVGELQKGLGGYLYVMCSNWECRAVNLVSYGTTHHNKTKGMPCFEINTKLGFGNYHFLFETN